MEGYVSQEAAITKQALKRGVDMTDVETYFDATLDRARRAHPNRSRGWLLGHVEQRVWENFFRGDPFPGKTDLPIQSTSQTNSRTSIEPIFKTEPLQDFTNRSAPDRGSQSRDPIDYWVHDRYEDHNKLEERLTQEDDLYRPQFEKRVARGDDFYRPKHGDSSKSKHTEVTKRAENSKPEETYGRSSRSDREVSSRTVSSLIVSSRTQPSERYISQKYAIKQKVSDNRISESRVDGISREEERFVEDAYPNKSRDWQKWATEKAVWKRLFKDDPFPGIEPARPTALASSQGLNKPPSGIVYQMQEKNMEAMAVRVGRRHEFFVFLQRARDQARHDHPDCSSEIRHYFADKMTWAAFFGKYPFVGVEPIDGHSSTCLSKSKQAEAVRQRERAEKRSTSSTPSVTSAPRSLALHLRSSQPQAESVSRAEPQTVTHSPNQLPQSGCPIPSQPSTTMLASLGIARYGNVPDRKEGIILISSNPVFCEIHQVKKVFTCFTTDTIQALAVIDSGLNCVLHFYRTTSGNLLLWATSAMVEGKPDDHGSAFLQGWVRQVLSSGPVRPSVYWSEMCKGMFSTARFHQFQTPEDCWEEYKSAIGASEIDCLVVGELAKSEGDVRMVLDTVTGEVVTIRELLNRDRARSSPPSGENDTAVLGQSAGGKRKHGEDSDSEDMENKRMCL